MSTRIPEGGPTPRPPRGEPTVDALPQTNVRTQTIADPRRTLVASLMAARQNRLRPNRGTPRRRRQRRQTTLTSTTELPSLLDVE